MLVNQLSVFMENKEGRLEQVLETLAEGNININSLSLAEATDYGMLRMMVSDPEAGKKAPSEHDRQECQSPADPSGHFIPSGMIQQKPFFEDQQQGKIQPPQHKIPSGAVP